MRKRGSRRARNCSPAARNALEFLPFSRRAKNISSGEECEVSLSLGEKGLARPKVADVSPIYRANPPCST
ncbi:hypothetical protein A2U01_0078500, partial [Trifolium medium]|nr:hypothetical protein [Trifolium medium]